MQPYSDFIVEVRGKLAPYRTTADMQKRCDDIVRLFSALQDWPHGNDLTQLQTKLREAHDELEWNGKTLAARAVFRIANQLQTFCTSTAPA